MANGAPVQDGNPIIDLYRSMVKSSDPEVKSYAMKLGYKDFSNKIVNDKEFRDQIYYGLTERGLTDLEPVKWEQSLGVYKGESPFQYMEGDAAQKVAEANAGIATEEVSEPEEDKSWLQKGIDAVGSVIDYTKDTGAIIAKKWTEGELIQEVTKNASAVDQAFFDAGKNPNLIDFDKVAQINKKIKDFGSTKTEEDFANPDTRGITDYIKMAIPTVLGSAATLARSGYDEIIGSGAAGGVGGLALGAATGPGAVATGIAGLGYGLQAGGAAAAAEMEYTLSIMSELEAKGVDITNPNALRKAWGNKKLMDPIRSDALKRTGIVLLADIAGGIAGGAVTTSREIARKSLDLANKGRKISKFAKVKDRMVDFAIEGTAGMTGEAGAILATKGEIKASDMPEIYLEGLGAIPAIEVMSKPITAPLERLIGGKEAAPTQAPEAAPAAAPPAGAGPAVEKVAVTQEEFDDFVNNNKISEARAGAIAEDAQLAMTDPKHMESLMAEDPLYAGMVEKFIEKGIEQKEVETITQAAYQDTAQFYGISQEELMNSVNQDHPSFNQEIADTFNNTFNRLFQSYREANDSQNISGVSGQVGEGQESQQAQPQQGGGTQEAGGSGVLQAPQGTVAQVGQVVQIDGKRYYVKDEGGGKLVVETDEGKIYEIPSDNPTIESIGAELLREAQPDKNYGIQVNSNDTATINGEKYTIVRDKQGNVTGARNQRRGNVTLNKAEVLGELQRQLSDPKLRQLTTVSVQQPLTQINETVQQEGTAPVAEPTQPQPASPEMAGQPVQEGGQATGVVQPGTEGGAQAVGAPVSGVTEAAPQIEQAPAAPVPAAPEALPSFEEYDSSFKEEGLKKGQRMQNKQEFSTKYGAEVYEGMRKINDNFTRITDALIKEGRLNKKC